MTDTAGLVVIDTVIPLGIAVVLIALNARTRVGVLREVRFWGFTLLYLGVIALFAVAGAASVSSDHGYGVLGALAFALPLSLPGAIVHQIAAWSLHVEMDPDITAIFGACVVCWALLNPLLLRRLVRSSQKKRAALSRSS